MGTTESFRKIRGGVTAPSGFVAAAAFCGIKPTNKGKPDLALLVSTEAATVAGTFTTNRVKAAPVLVSMEHVKNGRAQAILANSGNANACTGAPGLANARRLAAATASTLGLEAGEVVVCSTGRIGRPLPVEKMETALPSLAQGLRSNGGHGLAKAIMTSDTFAKEFAVEFELGGKTVRLGGCAKGAGMIDPNMATMLCFLTTDAAIPAPLLRKMLRGAVERSFNRITVDGDMSTNDTVLLLANGAAGAAPIRPGSREEDRFQAALDWVTRELAWMIVKDGEGVSKFVEVRVEGAASTKDARLAAEAIANSMLVKCSWAGNDPNWGRIVDAVGYCSAKIDPDRVDIDYDGVPAVRDGIATATLPARLKTIVRKPRFSIRVDLHQGKADHTVWTTDLTTEYVVLNLSE